MNKSKPSPKWMIILLVRLALFRAKSTPKVNEKINLPIITLKGRGEKVIEREWGMGRVFVNYL